MILKRVVRQWEFVWASSIVKSRSNKMICEQPLFYAISSKGAIKTGPLLLVFSAPVMDLM